MTKQVAALLVVLLTAACGPVEPTPEYDAGVSADAAAQESRAPYCLTETSLCRWIEGGEGSWYCGPCPARCVPCADDPMCSARDGGVDFCRL